MKYELECCYEEGFSTVIVGLIEGLNSEENRAVWPGSFFLEVFNAKSYYRFSIDCLGREI